MSAKKPKQSPVQERNRFPTLLILLSFAIGFCTHLLFSVIFAESKGDGVIHACVKKRSGEIRIITDFKEYREGKKEKERREQKEDVQGCRENEIALEWNKEGPKGEPGSGGSSFPFVCFECSFGNNTGDRLAGKNLTDAILVGSEFNNLNLKDTNFSRANLKQTNFNGANLSHANFETADLTDADMNETNLEGVKWNNTTCPDGSNSNTNGNTCDGHL